MEGYKEYWYVIQVNPKRKGMYFMLRSMFADKLPQDTMTFTDKYEIFVSFFETREAANEFLQFALNS